MMGNEMEDEIKLRLSRRDFLRRGANSVAGLFLTASGLNSLIRPTKAQAVENIPPNQNAFRDGNYTIRAIRPWTLKYYYPLDDTWAGERVLPTMHQDWGSAHLLDQQHQQAPENSGVNKNPQFQLQARVKADFILAKFSWMKTYAGHCPWLAAAQLGESAPPKKEGYEDWQTAGGLVMWWSGSALVTRPIDAQILAADLENGMNIIVNAPELGLEDQDWWNSVYGVNRENGNLLVAGLGQYKEIGIRRVKEACIVSHHTEVSESLRAQNGFWIYGGMNRGILDNFVYNP